MKRQKKFQRHGYFLLDSLITMSIIVVVLSMCGVWMVKTLKYASVVEDRAIHAGSIERIRLIRNWVRYSQSVKLKDDTLTIERAAGIRKVAIVGNEVRLIDESGEQKWQDVIRFDPTAVLSWEEDDLPGWITLTVQRKNELRTVTDLRMRMQPMPKIGAAQ